MTDLIDRIVSHVLDTPYDAFSAEDIQAGKNRILDVLGCAVSGARVPSNKPMVDLVTRWGGAEEATVIAGARRLPVAHAAMVNSLQARSFDFEVCGPEPEGVNKGKMVGHVGSTTEPTALAVGEFQHSTGKEMIAAVILGGDVAARISVSDTFSFDESFEVCGTSNAFGATAVAGRLMGLTHEQLRNAFGIAVNMMAGTFQGIWDGVASFKLPGAMAAFNGVLACELARGGFEGIKDALLSPRGFFAMYSREPQPDNMLADLGSIFYVRGQHKLHPSCYGNHNPIECALELRAREDFDVTAIESIVLEVQPHRINHFLNQPFGVEDGQAKALFNIPYGVANALLRGRPRLEHYLDESIHDPRVLSLVERVRLVPHSHGTKSHANRLLVTFRDGRTIESYREDPIGWLDNPTPQSEIDAKFWRNVEFHGGLSPEHAAGAFTAISTLESCPDVAEIARLLAG